MPSSTQNSGTFYVHKLLRITAASFLPKLLLVQLLLSPLHLEEVSSLTIVRVTEKEYPEGVYSGDVDEDTGRRHGTGTLVWKNGDRHQGEFRDDRPNGQGTYFYKNGET